MTRASYPAVWLFASGREQEYENRKEKVGLIEITLLPFGPNARLATVGGADLIIFLPAARPVQKLGDARHYTRLGWAERLPSFDCLYLADPFSEEMEVEGLAGSWFVGPDGLSVLPAMAEALRDFISKNAYASVMIYGSSMGGYAALILAYLIPNVRVIAECPQIYLEKYAPSQDVLDRYSGGSYPSNISTVEQYVCNGQTDNPVHILVSMHDRSHLGGHVTPLISGTRTAPQSLHLQVSIFCLPGYARGHVALSFADAEPFITTGKADARSASA